MQGMLPGQSVTVRQRIRLKLPCIQPFKSPGLPIRQGFERGFSTLIKGFWWAVLFSLKPPRVWWEFYLPWFYCSLVVFQCLFFWFNLAGNPGAWPPKGGHEVGENQAGDHTKGVGREALTGAVLRGFESFKKKFFKTAFKWSFESIFLE